VLWRRWPESSDGTGGCDESGEQEGGNEDEEDGNEDYEQTSVVLQPPIF
jgi:hypothetical protein